MKVNFEVDTKTLNAALLKMGREGVSILRKQLGTDLEDVRNSAAMQHRYITRSGNLDRAISVKVAKSGIWGMVFLRTGQAPYAIYQHEGTGRYGSRGQSYHVAPTLKKALHWGKAFSKGHDIAGIRPDRFLYAAFNRHKGQIVAGFSKAYRTLIRRAGFHG